MKIEQHHSPTFASKFTIRGTNLTTLFQVLQSDNTPVFNVDTVNERVGIGTATPLQALHIQDGFILIKRANNPKFSLETTGTPVLYNFTNDAGTFKIDNATAGLTRLSITASGQVGIGSGAFGAKLFVKGETDNEQLIVRAHSTQISNVFEQQKSDTTVVLSTNVDGDVDHQENAIVNFGQLAMKSAVEATISSGEITITEGHIKVDTEADAPNDDLDTINSTQSGEILFLLPANDDRTVRLRNGVGNIYLKHQVENKSYNFASPAGSSGIFYETGEYLWPTTDANLNQAGTTQTLGTANIAYAAHASLVAAAAGTATGGSGAVTIIVSGTSIDDEANRSAGDSETIVADITAMSTDEYFETSKKWIGQVTYTLTVGATGHTAYAADFNYGFSKYEDFGNQAFSITSLECVGLAGASDAGFNIRLFHHNSAGWTYAASGFVPGGTVLANMNTDHSTEQDLANGDPFAYKRTDLNTDISGDSGEGLILEVTTSANKAVENMDIHIGVHTAPNFAYLATTKQHLIFMKHGSNWLEL